MEREIKKMKMFQYFLGDSQDENVPNDWKYYDKNISKGWKKLS